MRIKVVMESEKEQQIDLNYNYYLSSLIYNLMSQNDKDYTSFLHEEGYEMNNKGYKMFTFSQLYPKNYEVVGNTLNIKGKIEWYVSSPMDKFLIAFVGSLMRKKEIRIKDAIFKVNNVEVIVEPEFSDKMNFRCISPIAIATGILTEGNKLKKYDLYIEDKRFVENIKQNILAKHEIIHGKSVEDDSFKIKFQNIEKYKKGKLIRYKNNINIKCYTIPFEIHGNPELIKVAYECGLGDRNSLGLGMIKLIEGR